MNDYKEATAYVAIINDFFIRDSKCLKEVKEANESRVPMFALLDSSVILPKELLEMPWKTVRVFESAQDLHVAYKKIMEDIENAR